MNLNKIKIAIQGVAGSFHEQATCNYFNSNDLNIIYCDTFDQVFNLVSKKNHLGVVAIENTVAGSILPNYRSLQENNFNIIGETYMRIEQDSLNSKGIKGIKGSIKLINENFNSYDVNPNWLWGDIGNYYGAGVSNLSFRDNMVEVYFNSSNNIGELTEISRTNHAYNQFNIENKVVSGKTKSDLAYAFGGPNNENRFIIGEIPAGKKDFKVKL